MKNPLNLVLTTRLFLFGYVLPMALMVAGLVLSVMWLGDANDAQNTAIRVEQRQNDLEAAQNEERRKARAELAKAADKRICKSANVNKDILADLLRRAVAEAKTPEEKKAARDFVRDTLRRLKPVNCNRLPTATLP